MTYPSISGASARAAAATDRRERQTDKSMHSPIKRNVLQHKINTKLGIVELCAKILQIMRNDFKDYARTFCQLCAAQLRTFFNSNFNQSRTEIEILCQHLNNDVSSELPTIGK